MTDPSRESVPSAAPGWYLDKDSGQLRWWDGAAWTDNFKRAGIPGWTVGGFIVALLSFFFGIVPGVGLILGAVGITVSIDQSRRGLPGRGLAVAGIILSALPVLYGAYLVWYSRQG